MIATGNHGDFDLLRGAQPLTQGRLWASPQITIFPAAVGSRCADDRKCGIAAEQKCGDPSFFTTVPDAGRPASAAPWAVPPAFWDRPD